MAESEPQEECLHCELTKVLEDYMERRIAAGVEPTFPISLTKSSRPWAKFILEAVSEEERAKMIATAPWRAFFSSASMKSLAFQTASLATHSASHAAQLRWPTAFRLTISRGRRKDCAPKGSPVLDDSAHELWTLNQAQGFDKGRWNDRQFVRLMAEAADVFLFLQ